MKENEMTAKKGFTIIEVSLVIAIAGLIFLMVFVALPGLRTQQRDTSRRTDVSHLVDSIKKYQTNNRGALPGSSESNNTVTVYGNNVTDANKKDLTKWVGFYANYLGENFVDPDGERYNLRIFRLSSTDKLDTSSWRFPNSYIMFIALQAKCSGDSVEYANNPRKFAVLYKMQGGGVACSDT